MPVYTVQSKLVPCVPFLIYNHIKTHPFHWKHTHSIGSIHTTYSTVVGACWINQWISLPFLSYIIHCALRRKVLLWMMILICQFIARVLWESWSIMIIYMVGRCSVLRNSITTLINSLKINVELLAKGMLLLFTMACGPPLLCGTVSRGTVLLSTGFMSISPASELVQTTTEPFWMCSVNGL